MCWLILVEASFWSHLFYFSIVFWNSKKTKSVKLCSAAIKIIEFLLFVCLFFIFVLCDLWKWVKRSFTQNKFDVSMPSSNLYAKYPPDRNNQANGGESTTDKNGLSVSHLNDTSSDTHTQQTHRQLTIALELQ